MSRTDFIGKLIRIFLPLRSIAIHLICICERVHDFNPLANYFILKLLCVMRYELHYNGIIIFSFSLSQTTGDTTGGEGGVPAFVSHKYHS